MSGSFNWNCALVTGGGGGLGKAIAQLFLSKGKQVIIAGRTESNLQATVKQLNNPKLSYVVLDTSKTETFASFVSDLLKEHPEVDCLVNNAGIQKPLSFTSLTDSSKIDAFTSGAESEIQTNITGVVNLTAHFLPHILSKPSGAIITVSSGLAFVPLTLCPVYSATKAFIHSYTLSLRYQLRDTKVKVIEVAPPLVGTDLHRDHSDPDNNKKEKNPMSLTVEEFINQVESQMEEGRDEVAPGFAEPRAKAWQETFGEMFVKQNSMFH
ncbi:putative short-chain dehydrogenases/reductase [Saitoella complicata NRRL Y-17804]|uniref:putative short-chain dehydrogenases/reductase n=1 Tax=Saitoella complicata (strain BCRC 22490 / CBS 7301 / JCM 7358 / NBRC 10748 / NRRL Y-17804) TaxID=698492 RepID=UPI00086801DE|nr:putative short-chain dehydrogenases/reductase [Saitoella complicata NRRL Y-17804]ODQ52062.1 putative short-chain dehydrogenases/reductase [Saitoella complicata NRRL Y-17804]